MAILKATVRFRNKSGLYPVYIRFTQVLLVIKKYTIATTFMLVWATTPDKVAV